MAHAPDSLPMPATRPGLAAARLAVGAVAAAVAFAIGGIVLPLFAIAVLLVVYWEFRRLLGAPGSRFAAALGAVAVGVAVWLGHLGRPEALPWALGGLVLLLFTSRLLSVELGRAGPGGSTDQVAATVAAAGVVGLLGGHILLIEAFPEFGFRALVVFVAMLAAQVATASVAGHLLGGRPVAERISPLPSRTWPAVVLGVAGPAVVGLLAMVAASPPFGARSGLLLGLAMGVLAPVGDLAGDALRRSAGMPPQLTARFGDEAFQALDAPLFCAPFYYWALHTLV